MRLVRVYTSTKVLGTDSFGIGNNKGGDGDITPCTRVKRFERFYSFSR
jgi:hypothetical protein